MFVGNGVLKTNMADAIALFCKMASRLTYYDGAHPEVLSMIVQKIDLLKVPVIGGLALELRNLIPSTQKIAEVSTQRANLLSGRKFRTAVPIRMSEIRKPNGRTRTRLMKIELLWVPGNGIGVWLRINRDMYIELSFRTHDHFLANEFYRMSGISHTKVEQWPTDIARKALTQNDPTIWGTRVPLGELIDLVRKYQG